MKSQSFALLAISIAMSLAPCAIAQQFRILNMSCGGYPNQTNPADPQALTSSSGLIYQHTSGSNYPPSAEEIVEEPELEYDSYIAAGSAPSTSVFSAIHPASIWAGQHRGHFTSDTSTIIDNSDWTQPLHHDWYANPLSMTAIAASFSTVGPNGYEATFIGRITVPRGEHVVASRLYFGVQTSTSHAVAGYYATVDGTLEYYDPYRLDRPPPPEATFRLISYLAHQVTLTGFGDADVYDLYVEAIPTGWSGGGGSGGGSSGGGSGGGGGDLPPPEDDDFEPNNAFAQASPVGPGMDNLKLSNDDDYFKVRLAAPGRLTFGAIFSTDPVEAELEVYDADNRLIGEDRRGSRDMVVSEILPAGEYCVRVVWLSGAASYELHATYRAESFSDANRDGDITPQDALSVLRAWGENAFSGPDTPEVSGDGVVNGADLDAVLSGLGYSREGMKTKAWKKAMQRFYNREVRPIDDSEPTKAQRKLDLQRLIESSP